MPSLPGVAVLRSQHPEGVDEGPTAVVHAAKLQADLPGPGVGACLGHVDHLHLTPWGHGHHSQGRRRQARDRVGLSAALYGGEGQEELVS